MTERARLFVATWPPAAVLDAIEALSWSEEPGVRYIPRQNWHVTLRFFGTCEVEAARGAFGAIEASTVVAEVGPKVKVLGKSVLVVPVGGLEPVAAAVVAATAGVGEPPDHRPFDGHVTVARLNRRRSRPSAAGQAIGESFPVTELALVRSDTRSTGAYYTTIATLPLSPPSPPSPPSPF